MCSNKEFSSNLNIKLIMSSAKVEEKPDDGKDQKFHCFVLDMVACDDPTKYSITPTNTCQISLKIWNRYVTSEGKTQKNDSRTLYYIRNDTDVQNLTAPIVSKADLESLFVKMLNMYCQDENKSICLMVQRVCVSDLLMFVQVSYVSLLAVNCANKRNQFMIEVDLEDVKLDKENSTQLEFLLIPELDYLNSESKHGDIDGDDVNLTINNDKKDDNNNVNEYQLWVSLWQKLQYNLSMTLSKAGINQWQNTHTLYFTLQMNNNEKENKNTQCLLVKSVNDLIDIAANKNIVQLSEQKQDSAKCRMVLKLKEIDWQEEYKYTNEQLIAISSNKNGGLRIKSRSENVFRFLMQQMSQRAKIVHNLRKVKRRKRRARKQNDQDQSFDTVLSDDQTNAMKNIFDILVQLLNDEGLTTGGAVDHDILANIAHARKAATVDNNWENGTKFLEKSMKSVKPFDIAKLVQCYGEFSHVSNKLRDENLVLFIGRTGSGKSTTIHFLKGTKFKRDPKHASHFIPENDNSNYNIPDDLKHIKLDYQVSESVTKYITPVAMSLNDVIVDDKNVKFTKNRIILCDTPGIGDSHGIEVEVANSLSLIHAIRSANSVCIVLVLSDEEKANRSELFKQTGHYVKSLLSDYKPDGHDDFESKLNDIGVIFTKFKNDEEIWDLFDKFEDENNPSVDGYHLAKKITSQQELILIDPITSQREEIIRQLLDSNNTESAVKWINNPKSNFVDDIPTVSLVKIKHQVKIDRYSIKHLISVGEPNFNIIEGKLDNLRELSKIMKCHKFVAKELTSSSREVHSRWKEICDSIIKNIKDHDNVTLETFNNNVAKVRKTIENVLKAHSRLQMKYLAKAPSFQQMRYEIFQEFCSILKEIEFHSNDKCSSEVSVVNNILKCLVISEHFQEEKRFINEFDGVMNELIKQCEEAMRNDKYLVVRYLTTILESIQCEWSTLATTKFSNTNNHCFVAVCKSANNLASQVKTHLQAGLQKLRSALVIITSDVAGSPVLFENGINEARKWFSLLDQSNQSFAGVAILEKQAHVAAQEATSILDQQQQQAQQKIANMLQMESEDKMKQNKDKWDMIRHSMRILIGLATIDSKFSMKSITVNREIMKQIVQRMILETTAKNNDLSLIRDNFDWIKEYYTDCNQLEQLYNDILRKNLNKIERQCQVCTMNILNLDVMKDQVKEISNLIHQLQEYCVNSSIADESVERTLNDTIQTLSDRISSMIYTTLFIGDSPRKKQNCTRNTQNKFLGDKQEEKQVENTDDQNGNLQQQEQLYHNAIQECFENGKYRYASSLSITKMDNLVKFIDICDNIYDATNVMMIKKLNVDLVYQFLQYYGKYRCQQISSAIDYLLSESSRLGDNAPATEEKDDVTDDTYVVQTPNADVVSNIGQIIEINGKYPKLKQFIFVDCDIDDLVDKWKNIMEIVLDNLENMLKNVESRKSAEFPAMISLIVALKKTTDCGVLDKDRFVKLYDDTKGAIDDDYQKLIENISSRKFSAVGKYMNAFDVKKILGKQYESLRGLLGEMLVAFGEEANGTLKNPPLTMSEYEAFITQFEMIIDALNDITLYSLDKQISHNDARIWNRLVQRISTAMKQWQRKLVSMIEKNAKTFMMVAAHARIEILHQIWDKTDNTCLKIEHQSNILAKIKQTIQQQLKNLEKSYSNWCIYDPKKWKVIKKKLPVYNQQIEQSIEFCQMHNNSNKYCQLYHKLCDNIWKTCKQSIDSVFAEISDVDENYYEHCDKLEFLDLLLNGAVVSQLKTKRNLEEATQFNHVYEIFWGKKNEEDEMLLEEMQESNFDDVEAFSAAFVELYLKYHARKQYDDQTVASKLLSMMIDKMQKHVDNIFNMLETQSESMSTLKSALRLMKQITDMEKIQYKPVLSMINKKFNKIRRYIEKWANKQNDMIIEHFSGGLVHDLPIVASIEIASDIRQRIWNLCELIILKGRRSYEPFIHDNFAIDIAASFIESLHTHFQILNKKFDSAVQRLDYSEIEMYFKYIEIYDSKTKCYHTIRRIYSEMNKEILQSICKTKNKQFNDEIMLSLEKMSQNMLDRLSKEQTKIVGQSLIHEQRFSSKAARITFYENVKYALEELKGSAKLSQYLLVDPMKELYGGCLTKISKEVKTATKRIANAFKAGFISEDSFKMINDLFSNLQVLSSMDLTGDPVNDKKFTVNIDSIKRKIVNQLVAVGDGCVASDSNPVNVAKFFIRLQMASHHLLDAELKEVTTTTIAKNLELYQKTHGILELAKILSSGKQLNENETIWGKEIVNTQTIFSGAAIQLWNAKMNEDIKYIEDVLRHTFIHLHTKDFGSKYRTTLKEQYVIFEKTYTNLLNRCINHWNVDLSPQENLGVCVFDTRVVAANIQHDNNDITKKVSDNFGENVSKLIAHIFSLWTFLDSKYYFNCVNAQDENELKTDELDSDTQSDEDITTDTHNDDHKSERVDNNGGGIGARGDPRYYLKQPKITQVIAVMILMSLDNHDDMKLVSNLVQIGTGEGKSLVLAVLACIFALLGYNVYCVSYGKLLAQRDHEAFWPLFTLLGIGNSIGYSTYESLCGGLLGEVVNHSKFRQTITRTNKDVNTDNDNKQDDGSDVDTSNVRINDSKRILLIDEVDVFFDERYFGKTISYATSFRHHYIGDWLDLIWEKIKIELSPFEYNYRRWQRLSTGSTITSMAEELKQTPQYDNLAKVFGFYMPIIDAQIMFMLRAGPHVLSENKRYIVYNDKIGFKRNDQIDTHIYGHESMFAYYFEHELGNISEKSLTTAKSMFIEYGSFSYAEIPRSFNNLIVGVTGTLITLTDYEKNILQDTYNINKYTYLPSIFKEAKLKFNKKNAVHLCSADNFAVGLQQNIETARKGISMVNLRGNRPDLLNQHRPVLVFFKDDKVLKKFYNSNEFGGLRNEALILNEELTHDEKMKLIKDACRLNTITLATRIFGRGTDFQVIDERVNKIGGTHVIQTFFSMNESEEVQITGRTARHGDPGSFSMVLDLDDVCRDFNIMYHDDKKAIQGAKDVYAYLSAKREEKMKDAHAVSLEKLEKAKKQHNQAYQLQHVLKENNSEEILKVLLQIQSC